MSKNKENDRNKSHITKGGAVATHDTVNFSQDKLAVLSQKPSDKKDGGNTSGGSQKH